jgi:A/G-specific adenine glycosylase
MNFNDELLSWYSQHKRDLPWRNTTDPYVIWLSEIILQQTRVEQGMPYFYRFLEKYPDTESFAAAAEEDVLKLWQGLGYYSRGRNMLKTARLVRDHFNGVFPTSFDQLLKLKGIGEYTASAIASFSANEPRAVIDGNVYRVLARYFGINEPINSTQGVKTFRQVAGDLLNKQYPGQHNQAMMELGATVCKPQNPACGICPVREGCYAFLHNAINGLPVKLNKVKVRERYFNYFLITKDESVLMNRRDEKDIWANMYDLPLIETEAMLPVEEVLGLPETQRYFGRPVRFVEWYPVVRHVLTHQRLNVRFVTLVGDPVEFKETWFYCTAENLPNLALPKVIFIFLKNIFNL